MKKLYSILFLAFIGASSTDSVFARGSFQSHSAMTHEDLSDISRDRTAVEDVGRTVKDDRKAKNGDMPKETSQDPKVPGQWF